MNLQNEALAQGLSLDEFNEIKTLLGREPNSVELSIFAVMWSEHCSYKSSKNQLKRLPTEGENVVQGPGENAGVVRFSGEQVLAFKIESHNHPSYIEPFQGAATGVGGILRDIFAMGARPIAVLNSLHFGSEDFEKTEFLTKGVVEGISHYGNCMGIPNVGGETCFDQSYNKNILVNAMAVGLCNESDIQRSAATGAGNRVIYMGAPTGRDGVHGATMASEEFSDESEEKRPTVQVGDPFAQKLLMEATLEITGKGLIEAVQDMGAAGITCSTFEMSDKGDSGMEIDLDQVPLRDQSLGAFEIFLSESQERMLLVCEPGNVDEIKAIAAKWDIPCADIGEMNDSGHVRAKHKGEVVVDLPVKAVTEGCKMLDRPFDFPKPHDQNVHVKKLPELDLKKTALELLALPNVRSKAWVYNQYDHTVGGSTLEPAGGDAAVMRIKGLREGLAMVVDSNAYYCDSDPLFGIQNIICEAIRNLACVGARPLGITNCLNFGNPEDPEVMGQFRYTIDGMKIASEFFDLPVTGGNVSFYNQTDDQNIFPTPTIGMVGKLDDVSQSTPFAFQHEDRVVAMLGFDQRAAVFDSEFARNILKRDDLACPPIYLEREKNLQETLIALNNKGLIDSAHDISRGGLIASLAECCVGQEFLSIGASIECKPEELWPIFLFAEYGHRVLISYEASNQEAIESLAEENECVHLVLGQTGGEVLKLGEVSISLDELKGALEI